MTSSILGHMTKWVRLPNHDKVRKCSNIPHLNDKGPTSTPGTGVKTSKHGFQYDGIWNNYTKLFVEMPQIM